jgi:nucleoid DNA-binding protein
LATETGEALDYAPKDTIEIVTDFLNRTIMFVREGNPIKFDGLGTFTLKDRAERQGRNPATGETITIAPSRVVTFKMDRGLKRSLAEE